MIFIFISKKLGKSLITWLLSVRIQLVKNSEGVLGLPVLNTKDIRYLQRMILTNPGVGHPAARLHLIGVKTPELQLLFKERATHIAGVVQLACTVVVQDLCKHHWVPGTSSLV